MVAYAPFEKDPPPPPRPIRGEMHIPVSDNTECNYIVMFFIAGVFLLGISNSFRK